jgi:hypothetical protein
VAAVSSGALYENEMAAGRSRNSARAAQFSCADKASGAPFDFPRCTEMKAAWSISVTMKFVGTQPLSRTQPIALLSPFLLGRCPWRSSVVQIDGAPTNAFACNSTLTHYDKTFSLRGRTFGPF